MQAFYLNKKFNRVELTITKHANLRMRERYERMTGEQLTQDEAEKLIVRLFNNARKVSLAKSSKKLQQRAKKHGATLYFRNGDYRFVVRNGVIVTVEVAATRARHLNNRVGGLNKFIDDVMERTAHSCV